MGEVTEGDNGKVDGGGGGGGGGGEGGELRVLVVDDSAVDRRIVEGLLKRSGTMFEVLMLHLFPYTILLELYFKKKSFRIISQFFGTAATGCLLGALIAVDSGKKAMEVLGLNEGKAGSPTVNDKKIDIILTDYCMPEMTGYDLLKAVKEQSCPKSIPVVIMSSENEPQRISRCRAIGAEDFILKPIQTKDVQKLRSYARPMAMTPKAGTKRKMPLDLIGENGGSERRLRLAEMAVA